mmetsp:Transcript_42088/g.113521  ORF Transcript_42088/g.113521 Transcript_42088/m.113521 type:complete len:201 (+) Transcript_42088:1008-1610(+)
MMLRKRHLLRDEDEVRGLVADVAVVEARRRKGERGLHEPVGLQLEEVHRLFVEGAAQTVTLIRPVHFERHLRKQARVQAVALLGIAHFEKELTSVVSAGDLDILLPDHLRDPVVLRQSSGRVEGLREPLVTKVGADEHVLVPGKLEAVEDARRPPRVALLDGVHGDGEPVDVRPLELVRAPPVGSLLRGLLVNLIIHCAP